MRRSDFTYDLPENLIAQRPTPQRSGSRLLHLDTSTGAIADRQFIDLPALLRPADLLVFNDTRVIPARVLGTKPTGGQVEILLERILDGRRILAHVHASKALRPEVPVLLPGAVEARFVTRHDDLFELELSAEPLEYFERHGAMPLPPYIERATDADDAGRYQTVYA
ncbi:MAG TPA: S-adenosylmethionine:tRNA ribosyltransferase-isomerase, partial [Povalibacter sp.]